MISINSNPSSPKNPHLSKHGGNNHNNDNGGGSSSSSSSINTSGTHNNSHGNSSSSTTTTTTASSSCGKNTSFPQISQFKATKMILNSAKHKLHSPHSISSNHPTVKQHQQQQQHNDQDVDKTNITSFTGIMYKMLVFIISLLPGLLIEKFLMLFAYVQIELIRAKGRTIDPERTYSKLKKKRKLKKKNKSIKLSHSASSSRPSSPLLTAIKEDPNNGFPSPSDMPVLRIVPPQTDGATPTTSTSNHHPSDIEHHKSPDSHLSIPSSTSHSHGHTKSLSTDGTHQIDNPELYLRQQHAAAWGAPNVPLTASTNSAQSQPATPAPSMRMRSDSICTSQPSRSISEIRRVNSEATLYQTYEDQMLFEANQQSRKEFEDFLRSVKDIKDVRNWLQNFSSSESKKIAIVKISRRILDTQFGVDQAAAALCFMYKFGLYPVVIHGGLNDIARLPVSQVIQERRSRSAILKEAIKKNGVSCTMLTPDICEIEPSIQDISDTLSEEELEFGKEDTLPNAGLAMKIDSFDYNILTQALEKGKIPIWDSVAETTDGVEIPINSDVTTFELAKRLQPFKIIFATNDGGILDVDHKAIPVVYLNEDFKRLMQSEHTTDRRRVLLKQMKRIVDHLPSSTSVIVTSIESITHQILFPRLANGTVIKRRQDNKVEHFDRDTLDNVDKAKLKKLIEDSFGRPLSPDYFEYLKDNLFRLYLCVSSEGEYNGCAVVTFKKPDYIPYLCKFCVQKSAQGLGLGDLIWRILQRDIDKLYWRSRNNNPLNSWYFQRCQGSFRADDHFTVFWYGDDKFEDGSMMIEEALRKPITVLPAIASS
ncbi:hypothetical protein SAMD00019534_056100 [Acytostelium subglobosum LB1]|uniref:hypothetical protein n=1 Tax=Acytostelium subglobosum LB1 TaxID=1410327 RepID=UPI000644C9DF|nr:hypothetical protein SAMD00019534_056100 [Acytostelium subglobosum LB1]GAM22435.1 hypothetical protein SAMD00019534_056100 [Acytostelium subglobosum LB1]|eukprot:XP_012754555.1 hypothetical protein SAMD00019534_056100 [Acytostelium subglobosum LB1]